MKKPIELTEHSIVNVPVEEKTTEIIIETSIELNEQIMIKFQVKIKSHNF